MCNRASPRSGGPPGSSRPQPRSSSSSSSRRSGSSSSSSSSSSSFFIISIVILNIIISIVRYYLVYYAEVVTVEVVIVKLDKHQLPIKGLRLATTCHTANHMCFCDFLKQHLGYNHPGDDHLCAALIIWLIQASASRRRSPRRWAECC